MAVSQSATPVTFAYAPDGERASKATGNPDGGRNRLGRRRLTMEAERLRHCL
jgi:hypothetical protein